jgi:hypothetical protein
MQGSATLAAALQQSAGVGGPPAHLRRRGSGPGSRREGAFDVLVVEVEDDHERRTLASQDECGREGELATTLQLGDPICLSWTQNDARPAEVVSASKTVSGLALTGAATTIGAAISNSSLSLLLVARPSLSLRSSPSP